jgi:hypothetical protein
MIEAQKDVRQDAIVKSAIFVAFACLFLFVMLDIKSGSSDDQMRVLITLSSFIFIPGFLILAAYATARLEPADASRGLFRLVLILYGLSVALDLLLGILLLSSSDAPRLGMAPPTFYYGILFFILLLAPVSVSGCLLLRWRNSFTEHPGDSWLAKELRDRAGLYRGVILAIGFFAAPLIGFKFGTSDGGVRSILGLAANMVPATIVLFYPSSGSRTLTSRATDRPALSARGKFWLLLSLALFGAALCAHNASFLSSKTYAAYAGITSPSYFYFGLLQWMQLAYGIGVSASLLVLLWGEVLKEKADAAHPAAGGPGAADASSKR